MFQYKYRNTVRFLGQNQRFLKQYQSVNTKGFFYSISTKKIMLIQL